MAKNKHIRRRRRRRAHHSDVTYKALETIEQTARRTMSRPRTLPLAKIMVADQVFQWRLTDENLIERERHTRVLRKAVERGGRSHKALAPLVVTAVGDKFYLIDGHHRLEAYEKERWPHEVPVIYFEGRLRDACVEGLRRNVKDKLPMTLSDKREAAWRLVKMGGYTQTQIHSMTGHSVRSISTMYGVWKAKRGEVRQLTWKTVLANNYDDGKMSGGDWFEEKAQKLAKQIHKNVGPGFVRDTDVTARALEIISANLPEGLIREWLQQARDIVEEETREAKEMPKGKTFEF